MKYTVTELLAWGKDHHYPQLVLHVDERGHVHEYVKHGELHWHRMARSKELRAMAWKRIQMWNEYAQQKAS